MKEEIKDHPMLTMFIGIISTAVIMLGTTTFATMNYVDGKYDEAKEYTQEKHDSIKNGVGQKYVELKKDMTEIKGQIQREFRNVNNNILKLHSRDN